MDSLFFYISKLAWALLSPDSLLLLLWFSGALSLAMGAARLAKKLLGVASVFSLAIALLPLGESVYLPLERQFPPLHSLPPHVDGIIVLGGFVEADETSAWQQVQTNSSAERLWAFTQLARRYPQAQLVFTGGSGSLLNQEVKEADFLRELMTEAGFADRPLVLESQSRNTYENVVYSKALVQPAPDSHWLLITSAFHMPRAVGLFCAQQWPVQAYSVDFRSDTRPRWKTEWRFAEHLAELTDATREWVGLLAYYTTGKTSQFLANHSSPCVLSE